MKNKITETIGRNTRYALLIWVLIANTIIFFTGLEHPWLIFISNIIMFILPGDDMIQKFKTVTFGGGVGIILTFILMILIDLVSPYIGGYLGFIIPLGIGLYILICLHPKAPMFLNNVGFAYLTVCALHGEDFIMNFSQYFLTFLIGGLIFNGGAIIMINKIKKITLEKYNIVPETNK